MAFGYFLFFDVMFLGIIVFLILVILGVIKLFDKLP